MKQKLLSILIALASCLFTACKEKSAPSNNDDVETNYVDLGLSSGTLWKNVNEKNAQKEYDLFTFDEAVKSFGYQLPTKEQWLELIEECTWSWTFGGYKIIGLLLQTEETVHINVLLIQELKEKSDGLIVARVIL